MSIAVGDIVTKVNTYWEGELNEPPLSQEEKEELFVVTKTCVLGCCIKSLKTGNESAWWNYRCLKIVNNK